MKVAGVEMTQPLVATEVNDIILVHEHDGLVSWRIQGRARTVVAVSPKPETARVVAQHLAGLLELDATVDYYAQRIARGSLDQADSADGRRFLFHHVESAEQVVLQVHSYGGHS